MTTKKTIDMSPEAVTNRMIALDELWEIGVALKGSQIVEEPVSLPPRVDPPEVHREPLREG